MDLLERLTQEHRDVEALLEALSDAEDAERAALIEQLEAALTRHMAVEEQQVYPLVARAVGAEAEAEAESEHELAREGLTKLRAMQDKPGFGAAVDMLAAGIRHHVQEEEDEVFPQLRKQAADEVGNLVDAEGRDADGRDADGRDADGRDAPTKEELYQQAKEAGIEGRSTMSKQELEDALAERR